MITFPNNYVQIHVTREGRASSRQTGRGYYSPPHTGLCMSQRPLAQKGSVPQEGWELSFSPLPCPINRLIPANMALTVSLHSALLSLSVQASDHSGSIKPPEISRHLLHCSKEGVTGTHFGPLHPADFWLCLRP